MPVIQHHKGNTLALAGTSSIIEVPPLAGLGLTCDSIPRLTPRAGQSCRPDGLILRDTQVSHIRATRSIAASMAGLVPRPCPTRSSRDARYCGRSRSSTVPYEVLARRAPSWQVSFLDRALRGPRATLAFVAGLVPRPCPTRSSRDVRHRGRSRSSTVPYEVLARRAALRQVSYLDRALRGPRATCGIAAGLVPRPCPTGDDTSAAPL